MILGDFNTRVGKSAAVDDVISMIGEDTCNRNGNTFLNEVEGTGVCLNWCSFKKASFILGYELWEERF